ncbi:CotH kinase family protein [Marininema halotolerans]|uniref:Spore coat protein H n=1 Tax=Marininema halotolerans TaxID=1155944 RepID=A0A1I6R3K3_9BACL|nr:CotH kinase family protein [Marininema halotolerans]SFS59068.1 spore coat protein H [Marininema halotolerans]
MRSPLPIYTLQVDPTLWQQMKFNVWSSHPAPALLRIEDGEEVRVGCCFRGAHTRVLLKKSYYLIDEEHGQEVHLNAEYVDNSFIRNKLSLDFFRSIGVMSPRSRHVWLRINDKDEGLYLALESVNASFFRRRNKPRGSIHYAVNDDANFSRRNTRNEIKEDLLSGYERKEGVPCDDETLRNFLSWVNGTHTAIFREKIGNYLDVENYLRWLAGVVCTQNYDGFLHNYALYRNPLTGCFQIIPWDFDATWGRDCNGRVMKYNFVSIKGDNQLSARLLAIPQYRRRYCDILEVILHKYFHPKVLQPIIQHHYEQLAPYVYKDPYKPGLIKRFRHEHKQILAYIHQRRTYLLKQLKELSAHNKKYRETAYKRGHKHVTLSCSP